MIPWSWAACLVATLVAGTPVTMKVSVTGLFSPDRETDLREVFAGWPEVKLVGVDFDRAEAELAFDADKLLGKAKPADMIARINERVGQLSRNAFGVRAASATPRDKLTRVEIPVAGLDCKACSLGVYEVIAKVEGVEQATVSFKDGRVTALIDPTKTDRAKLAALLKQRGVDVR